MRLRAMYKDKWACKVERNILFQVMRLFKSTTLFCLVRIVQKNSLDCAHVSVLESDIYPAPSSFICDCEKHERLDMTKRTHEELLDMSIDNDESSSESVAQHTSSSTSKKPTHKRAKSHLKCVVCDDIAEGKATHGRVSNAIDAIAGYNFDAISCESCKAFFRRNALGPTVRIGHIEGSTVSA